MIEEIWTEKYRPKTLQEVIGQDHATSRLKSFVDKKSLPHCLFAGPAGCGKSTSALAIAREMFGENCKSNFLELNSSDERGIDTVRVKVKDFARTRSFDGGFKIIFLDEADSLTKDAQHALRRTMEKYSDTARFILGCNYSSKILEPIQSRTAIFRFSPVKNEDLKKYVQSISASENLIIDEDAINAIVDIAEGDMRKAVNILQTAAISGQDITKDVIFNTTSTADPDEVKNMINKALDGNFHQAREHLINLIHTKGLAGEDLIKQIHNQVNNMDMVDQTRIKLLERIGEYEFRLTEGSNSQIQLEALLAQICLMKS